MAAEAEGALGLSVRSPEPLAVSPPAHGLGCAPVVVL